MLQKIQVENFNRIIKDQEKYDFNQPLHQLAAQFINERWDYNLNSHQDIAEQIKTLPITVAVVADVDKIKPGGGKKAKTLLEHIADISESDLADMLKDLEPEDQEKLKKALGI